MKMNIDGKIDRWKQKKNCERKKEWKVLIMCVEGFGGNGISNDRNSYILCLLCYAVVAHLHIHGMTMMIMRRNEWVKRIIDAYMNMIFVHEA